MIFIIGWSGVSNAALQNMHIAMMMQHTPSESVAVISQHELIHDVLTQESAQNHCELATQQLENALNHHVPCQDCIYFSCHVPIIGISSDIPMLEKPWHNSNSYFLPSDYQAQHLTGFWQKILRPPKA